MEDLWAICFSEEEQPGNLNDGVRNGGGVEYPPPGAILSDESACDWTKSRSEQGGKTVDRNAFTALARYKAVGEDTAANLKVILIREPTLFRPFEETYC